MPRDEAVAYFKRIGEHYKAEIIASIPADEDDLALPRGRLRSTCAAARTCRRTGKLKVFKLMKVAGAYWRGDSKQRDAAAHLRHRLGEQGGAATRTCTCSRKPRSATTASSASELDLFHMQDEAPGLVFWHPKGWAIWQQVEQYMRERLPRQRLPGSARARRSSTARCGRRPGHWENYRENMFTTESEKRDYALKPMNCPGHVLIFKQGLRSYRDLPLRYGEFGAVPSQRAVGRAARHHARARLHAGRRPHLLHRGPDPSPKCTAFTTLAA